MFKGVYGLKNILNVYEISYSNPYSYVPLFDPLNEDYPINLYDWIHYHAPTCKKIQEVDIYGYRMIIPCERNTLREQSKLFDYNPDNIPLIKTLNLPFINWYDDTYGLSITTSIIGSINKHDEFICRQVAKRWSSIIKTTHSMKIEISFEELGDNILGSAGPTHVVYKNNYLYSTQGVVQLNTKYWNKEKSQLKYNHKSSAYYTLLHEVGHVIGIGTLWLDNYLLSYGPYYIETEYWKSNYTNALYIGSNGLREYKKYIINKYNVLEKDIIGIPVEEDGGEGTKGGHIEEGDSSHSKRHFDGKQHFGLDNELMTGYSEYGMTLEPLSVITIGMLQDIGYDVDYSKADKF
jgi:hypothetical protein